MPVVVLNKADLCEDPAAARESVRARLPMIDVVGVSALEDAGLDALAPYSASADGGAARLVRRRQVDAVNRDPRCPTGSLTGKIALDHRGTCSFASKAERAALAGRDRYDLHRQPLRRGEPDPDSLPIPAGMISDLDGQSLRAFADASGGSGDDPRLGGDRGDPDRPRAA